MEELPLEVTMYSDPYQIIFTRSEGYIYSHTIDIGPRMTKIERFEDYEIWKSPYHTYASGQYRNSQPTTYYLVEIKRDFVPGEAPGIGKLICYVEPGRRWREVIEALLEKIEEL